MKKIASFYPFSSSPVDRYPPPLFLCLRRVCLPATGPGSNVATKKSENSFYNDFKRDTDRVGVRERTPFVGNTFMGSPFYPDLFCHWSPRPRPLPLCHFFPVASVGGDRAKGAEGAEGAEGVEGT